MADALARAGLRPPESFFTRYPYEISGGQRQRVIIAGAMVLNPSLLVADEPVSALDASVRGEILALMLGLVREAGVSILVVTHDLGLAWNVADRVAVMYLGRIVEDAPAEQLLTAPRHPYTRALLSVVPETQAHGAADPHGRGPRSHAHPARLPLPSALPARGVGRGRAARHRGALQGRGSAVPSRLPRGSVSSPMSTRLTYTSGDLGAETDAAFEAALEEARELRRRGRTPHLIGGEQVAEGERLRAPRPGEHRARGEPGARGRPRARGARRRGRARGGARLGRHALRGALRAAARRGRRDRRAPHGAGRAGEPRDRQVAHRVDPRGAGGDRPDRGVRRATWRRTTATRSRSTASSRASATWTCCARTASSR